MGNRGTYRLKLEWRDRLFVDVRCSNGNGSTSNVIEGEAEATTSKNKSYSTTETSELRHLHPELRVKALQQYRQRAVQASQLLLVTSLLMTKKKYRT